MSYHHGNMHLPASLQYKQFTMSRIAWSASASLKFTLSKTIKLSFYDVEQRIRFALIHKTKLKINYSDIVQKSHKKSVTEKKNITMFRMMHSTAESHFMTQQMGRADE